MISGSILLWAYRVYRRDCREIGRDNLAVPWGKRIMVWAACGFWMIDVAILFLVIAACK